MSFNFNFYINRATNLNTFKVKLLNSHVFTCCKTCLKTCLIVCIHRFFTTTILSETF